MHWNQNLTSGAMIFAITYRFKTLIFLSYKIVIIMSYLPVSQGCVSHQMREAVRKDFKYYSINMKECLRCAALYAAHVIWGIKLFNNNSFEILQQVELLKCVSKVVTLQVFCALWVSCFLLGPQQRYVSFYHRSSWLHPEQRTEAQKDNHDGNKKQRAQS